MPKKLFLIIAFFSLVLFWPSSALASSLYLSPASGTVGIGGIISVRVNLNTGGEGVNGVSAFLSYPTDKLEVTSLSFSNTFGIAAEGSYGGGSIRISRGNINAVSGNVNVATIRFKGKSLGSAGVNFAGGSAVPRASDSSDSYTGGSGGNFSVVKAVSTPVSSSDSVSETTPAPDTTAPTLSDIQVKDVATNSAAIDWKTDEETDSFVEYGLEEGKYFLNAANGNFTLDHSLKLEGPALTPGAIFHFRVVVKDKNSNVSTSKDMQFTLTGYKVKIKVLDQYGKPVSKAEVLLYSSVSKVFTDDRGEAVFDNVTLGKHLAVVKTAGLEKSREIEVLDSKEQVQGFNVQVKSSPNRLYFIIPAAVGLVVIAAGAALIFIRKRKQKMQIQQPSL